MLQLTDTKLNINRPDMPNFLQQMLLLANTIKPRSFKHINNLNKMCCCQSLRTPLSSKTIHLSHHSVKITWLDFALEEAS